MGLISLRADTGMAPTARSFRAEEGVLCFSLPDLSLRLYAAVIFSTGQTTRIFRTLD
jgi:hypothetical protein